MKLTFSKPLHKGFTLIELMIVIAIFAKENSIPLSILILKRFINFECQPIV